MKRIISILLLAVLFAACDTNYQRPVVVQQPLDYDYQVITSPTGQQMVVYNYNGREMMLDYMLWQSLYNRGGWTGVNNYYNTNPSYFRPYNSSNYSGWKTSTFRNNYNNYGGTTTTSRNTYSPTARQPTYRGNSQPTTTQRTNGFGQQTSRPQQRTNGFGTTPSYKSPIRSNGFGQSSRTTTTRTTTSRRTQ
jgi:hypothetical protein